MTPGGQASAEATTNAYHDCILARGPDDAARGDAHLLPLRSPRSDQKTDPALGAAPLGWRALMGPSPLGGLTYRSALSKDKRQALAACMRGGARQARGAATQGRLRRVVRRAMRRKLGAEPRTGGCDGRCDGRCCASLERRRAGAAATDGAAKGRGGGSATSRAVHATGGAERAALRRKRRSETRASQEKARSWMGTSVGDGRWAASSQPLAHAHGW